MKLRRRNNETHKKNLIYFEKFITEMTYYNIKHSALHQVLVFLDELNASLLGNLICIIMYQDPNAIYSNWIVAEKPTHFFNTLAKLSYLINTGRRGSMFFWNFNHKKSRENPQNPTVFVTLYLCVLLMDWAKNWLESILKHIKRQKWHEIVN